MMADAAMRYQDRKDQMSATDAFLAAQAQVRELRLGVGKNGEQTGYLATSGKAAMNGYQSHVAGFNSIYQAGADGLSGNARQKYLAMSVRQLDKLRAEAAQQRFNGEKQYQQEQLVLEFDGMKDEANINPMTMYVPVDGVTPYQRMMMKLPPEKRNAAAQELAMSGMHSYYRGMEDADATKGTMSAYPATRAFFNGIKDELPADAKNAMDKQLDIWEGQHNATLKNLQSTHLKDARIGANDKAPELLEGFMSSGGNMGIATVRDEFTKLYLNDSNAAKGQTQFLNHMQTALRSRATDIGYTKAVGEFNTMISSDSNPLNPYEENELATFMGETLRTDMNKVQALRDTGTMSNLLLALEKMEGKGTHGDYQALRQGILGNEDMLYTNRKAALTLLSGYGENQQTATDDALIETQADNEAIIFADQRTPGADQDKINSQIIEDVRDKTLTTKQAKGLYAKALTKDGLHPPGAKKNMAYMGTYKFIQGMKKGRSFVLDTKEVAILREQYKSNPARQTPEEAALILQADDANAAAAGRVHNDFYNWYVEKSKTGTPTQADISDWQTRMIGDYVNKGGVVTPGKIESILDIGGTVLQTLFGAFDKTKDTLVYGKEPVVGQYFNRIMPGKDASVMETAK